MNNWARSFWALVALVTLTSSALAEDKPKTEKVYVEGQSIVYTTTNRVSVITGAPVVVKDLTSGMQLSCETLRVSWSTNNSGIDVAYADTKVVITMTDKDGVRTATGEHAVYDGKTEVITLTGNPVLETPMGRMWDADKVVFEKAVGKFSALGGKIKGEFKMQKIEVKKPNATEQKK